MVSNNSALYSVKILAEISRDLIFFPLWWYTRGLVMVLLGLVNFIKNMEKSLALFVWMKNIFVPMYGQRDIQGWAISVFIRVIQIIFRGFILLIIVLLSVLLFIFWLVFPFFVAYQIMFQLGVVELIKNFFYSYQIA